MLGNVFYRALLLYCSSDWSGCKSPLCVRKACFVKVFTSKMNQKTGMKRCSHLIYWWKVFLLNKAQVLFCLPYREAMRPAPWYWIPFWLCRVWTVSWLLVIQMHWRRCARERVNTMTKDMNLNLNLQLIYVCRNIIIILYFACNLSKKHSYFYFLYCSNESVQYVVYLLAFFYLFDAKISFCLRN